MSRDSKDPTLLSVLAKALARYNATIRHFSKQHPGLVLLSMAFFALSIPLTTILLERDAGPISERDDLHIVYYVALIMAVGVGSIVAFTLLEHRREAARRLSSAYLRHLGGFESEGRDHDDLLRRLGRIEERIGETRSGLTLSEEERRKFLERLGERIDRSLNDDFVNEMNVRFEQAFSNNARLQTLRDRFEATRARLLEEIGTLNTRGSWNLAIGSSLSGAAIILLGALVYQSDLNGPWPEAIPTMVLRLSLVAFMELFALFFLRLYRWNLVEIKYFQNELTTCESRALALEMALMHGDDDVIGHALMCLSNVDRNRGDYRGQNLTGAQVPPSSPISDSEGELRSRGNDSPIDGSPNGGKHG